MATKTTPVTGYGLIGTDYVRLTVIDVDGTTLIRRADGTNTIVDVLPNVWRTSGDIVAAAALLGHRVNMAAVPKVGLPNHAWKTTFDTFDFVLKMTGDKAKAEAIMVGLMVSYMSDEELEAAA